MPKLPPDMEHRTTFHELNEFMNEYYSEQQHQEEHRSRPPDQLPGHRNKNVKMGSASKMEIKLDLTGTETFGQLLNILHFAFKRADLDTQRQIYYKLKREIGQTHDLRLFER